MAAKVRFVTILILFWIQSTCQVTNYINNGSFEERYNCTYPFTLMKAKSWSSIDSGSVAGLYASTCNSYVPFNGGGGYQYPKTGSAHVVSTFYWKNTGRSYLKNRLKQNLVAGKTYCAKFYVSITNSSTYGIDGFGVYFGDNSIDTITKCTFPIPYLTPQVQNASGNIITDTLNWVLIQGNFVADGSEKYALIGNFMSDAATNTLFINPTNSPLIFTDVCIDDVSCIDIDLLAYAGKDTSCVPGDSAFIGRQPDVGINEACKWYQMPNLTTAIDTVAGFWVKPLVTTTYVVKQEICGNIKWDTVVIYANPVGLTDGKIFNKNLHVYPVPANDLLELKISNEGLFKDFKMLKIYNSLGQIVRDEEVIFKKELFLINTEELPNGVYTLQLKSNRSGTIGKRFLVAR
jgi:hypothetical protein